MVRKKKEESEKKITKTQAAEKQARPRDKKSKQVAKEMIIPCDELEKLKEQAQKAQEYHEQYLRQLAELENFRKRKEKERHEYIKYANESLVAEIIPIMDNFELAFSAAEKNPATHNFAVGVEMILGQMKEMLKSYGISEINPEGGKFDPHLHEAVEHVETDEVGEDMVVEVVKKGYMLNDRVIQPASVKVSGVRFRQEDAIMKEKAEEDVQIEPSEEVEEPSDK